MNFLIFLNSRGPGSKFQISSGGGPDLWSGGGGAGLAPRQLGLCIKTIILWNTCIGALLDPPISSTALQSDNPQDIIPGSNINSDLTISFGTFKTRLKNLLLNSQKLGNHIDWIKSNSLGH